MEELDNVVANSLKRYFTVLESIGYISDADVNKLVLLLFLLEFLYNCQGYITELDYNKIESILQCLAGSSCLIPYKQYMLASNPSLNYLYNSPVRIALNSILRHLLTGGNLRLVNL